MTQFQASLIAAGDPQPLPTTIALDGDRIAIASNGQSIGEWPIDSVGFERVGDDFKVTLDGETAVLKFDDTEQFDAELAGITGSNGKSTKAKLLRKPKKAKTEKKTKAEKKAPVPQVKKAVAKPVTAPVASTPKAKKENGALEWLDGRLESAHKKWSKYAPDWFFTRGGVAVAGIVLIALLLKPSWFSALFLIVAAIGLITSAIALLDQMIAVKIFRKGFTPIQGLIGSLSLGIVGLLLGAL